MAETALVRRRRFALQTLTEHLLSLGARALSVEQVRAVEKTGREGWSLSGQSEGMFVVLTDDWPFIPPEFYISKKHPSFHDAHVGHDGKLCLAPSHSIYSQRDPIALFDALLVEAHQLLGRGEIEAQELVDEFQSYWLRDMLPKRACLSLLAPNGPSRMVACWHGEKLSVYGESKEEVTTFLKRRFGLKTDPTVTEEPFLWFSRGLVPKEFPRRARGLWDLTRELSPEGLELLPPVVANPASRIAFGFETSNGPALAAVVLRRSENFTQGFRERSMCKAVAVSRFFGASKVEACIIQRVDHAWIHSRGGEQSHIGMKEKTVVILGCGSLGAGVAMLLAKTGVGNLILVDGEELSWNNIGRHVLGASSVNQNKAKAMAREIHSQLPTINAEGISKTWQEAQRSGELDFGNVDLVISTSGDWASDSMLNFEGRTRMDFPPVIFTWLEAHALAGHAMVMQDVGGCFACGVDEFGNFAQRATEWSEGVGLEHEPACGAYFQPYGPSQVASTQGLAATLAVDVLAGGVERSELRTWVAAKARVESLGGQWTQRVSISGISTEGGFITEKWPVSPNCELC